MVEKKLMCCCCFYPRLLNAIRKKLRWILFVFSAVQALSTASELTAGCFLIAFLLDSQRVTSVIFIINLLIGDLSPLIWVAWSYAAAAYYLWSDETMRKGVAFLAQAIIIFYAFIPNISPQ